MPAKTRATAISHFYGFKYFQRIIKFPLNRHYFLFTYIFDSMHTLRVWQTGRLTQNI